MDLALNNLQILICHKTKQTNQTYIYIYIYMRASLCVCVCVFSVCVCMWFDLVSSFNDISIFLGNSVSKVSF